MCHKGLLFICGPEGLTEGAPEGLTEGPPERIL